MDPCIVKNRCTTEGCSLMIITWPLMILYLTGVTFEQGRKRLSQDIFLSVTAGGFFLCQRDLLAK